MYRACWSWYKAPDPPHCVWANAIAPRLRIASGETVRFDTRDADDLAFNPRSTTADLVAWTFRGHPLTGPAVVEGALFPSAMPRLPRATERYASRPSK